VKLLTALQVVDYNRKICELHDHRHQLYEVGKIESSLHSAFYPGIPPFQHGGIASIAGCLAYYICKAHAFFDANKRTSVIASIAFMKANGYDLRYPSNPDALYKLIEDCADNKIQKEDMMNWYDQHKVKI